MSNQNLLDNQQIQFLQNLGIDPNSENLKIEIQSLLQSQQNIKNQKSNNFSANPNSQLSTILNKIYTEIIPELQKQGKTWDIDYDFNRKENKRYENLKKRGCGRIIKVE